MNKLAAALGLLRDDAQLEKMSKGAGVLSGVASVLKAGDKAGQAAAKHLVSQGHGNLAMVARVTQHVAAAAGAKAAYESEPAQKLRYKIRVHKARKAMRQARRQSQRGYR